MSSIDYVVLTKKLPPEEAAREFKCADRDGWMDPPEGARIFSQAFIAKIRREMESRGLLEVFCTFPDGHQTRISS